MFHYSCHLWYILWLNVTIVDSFVITPFSNCLDASFLNCDNYRIAPQLEYTCRKHESGGILVKPHIRIFYQRLVGLGVWFSLRVREVLGSNPGRAQHFFSSLMFSYFVVQTLIKAAIFITFHIPNFFYCYCKNFFQQH